MRRGWRSRRTCTRPPGSTARRAYDAFRRVTLPLLGPAIVVALLFRYIFAFRIFSEVWLMTQGGPARSTEVVAVYLYQEAFRFNAFGTAAATAWIMVARFSLAPRGRAYVVVPPSQAGVLGQCALSRSVPDRHRARRSRSARS